LIGNVPDALVSVRPQANAVDGSKASKNDNARGHIAPSECVLNVSACYVKAVAIL